MSEQPGIFRWVWALALISGLAGIALPTPARAGGATVSFTITNSDGTAYNGPLMVWPINWRGHKEPILADGSFFIAGIPQRLELTNGLGSGQFMQGPYFASNSVAAFAFAVPLDSGSYNAADLVIGAYNIFRYVPGVTADVVTNLALAAAQEALAGVVAGSTTNAVTNGQSNVTFSGLTIYGGLILNAYQGGPQGTMLDGTNGILSVHEGNGDPGDLMAGRYIALSSDGFAGAGPGLSNLNASALSSGTVSTQRLANIGLNQLDAATSNKVFNAGSGSVPDGVLTNGATNVTFSGFTTYGGLILNAYEGGPQGSMLDGTNGILSVHEGNGDPGDMMAGRYIALSSDGFAGAGPGLSNLNASALSSGTLSTNRLANIGLNQLDPATSNTVFNAGSGTNDFAVAPGLNVTVSTNGRLFTVSAGAATNLTYTNAVLSGTTTFDAYPGNTTNLLVKTHGLAANLLTFLNDSNNIPFRFSTSSEYYEAWQNHPAYNDNIVNWGWNANDWDVPLIAGEPTFNWQMERMYYDAIGPWTGTNSIPCYEMHMQTTGTNGVQTRWWTWYISRQMGDTNPIAAHEEIATIDSWRTSPGDSYSAMLLTTNGLLINRPITLSCQGLQSNALNIANLAEFDYFSAQTNWITLGTSMNTPVFIPNGPLILGDYLNAAGNGTFTGLLQVTNGSTVRIKAITSTSDGASLILKNSIAENYVQTDPTTGALSLNTGIVEGLRLISSSSSGSGIRFYTGNGSPLVGQFTVDGDFSVPHGKVYADGAGISNVVAKSAATATTAGTATNLVGITLSNIVNAASLVTGNFTSVVCGYLKFTNNGVAYSLVVSTNLP